MKANFKDKCFLYSTQNSSHQWLRQSDIITVTFWEMLNELRLKTFLFSLNFQNLFFSLDFLFGIFQIPLWAYDISHLAFHFHEVLYVHCFCTFTVSSFSSFSFTSFRWWIPSLFFCVQTWTDGVVSFPLRQLLKLCWKTSAGIIKQTSEVFCWPVRFACERFIFSSSWLHEHVFTFDGLSQASCNISQMWWDLTFQHDQLYARSVPQKTLFPQLNMAGIFFSDCALPAMR